MNVLVKIVILYFLTINFSCKNESLRSDSNSTINIFEKYANDSVRNEIFKIAYDNNSTAPNYIVFKAKNLNSGIIKEICSEAPFLSGALHLEYEKEYGIKDSEFIDSIILENNNKLFEFKDLKALENISFFEYPDYDRIIEIAKSMDLDYYHDVYSMNDSLKLIYFENDTGFVQLSFAHIMFNCGILTRRDCEAGNNLWFGDPRND